MPRLGSVKALTVHVLLDLCDKVFKGEFALVAFAAATHGNYAFFRFLITDYQHIRYFFHLPAAYLIAQRFIARIFFRAYARRELDTMWDEYRRLMQPHIYKVDLSDRLYDLKKRLIREHTGGRA